MSDTIKNLCKKIEKKIKDYEDDKISLKNSEIDKLYSDLYALRKEHKETCSHDHCRIDVNNWIDHVYGCDRNYSNWVMHCDYCDTDIMKGNDCTHPGTLRLEKMNLALRSPFEWIEAGYETYFPLNEWEKLGIWRQEITTYKYHKK